MGLQVMVDVSTKGLFRKIQKLNSRRMYSAPDQVMEKTEEHMARKFLAEEVKSLLCIGVNVFGQR